MNLPACELLQTGIQGRMHCIIVTGSILMQFFTVTMTELFVNNILGHLIGHKLDQGLGLVENLRN